MNALATGNCRSEINWKMNNLAEKAGFTPRVFLRFARLARELDGHEPGGFSLHLPLPKMKAEAFIFASGEGGIRTRVTREGPKVFETWPFNRSGTSPVWQLYRAGSEYTRRRPCQVISAIERARPLAKLLDQKFLTDDSALYPAPRRWRLPAPLPGQTHQCRC